MKKEKLKMKNDNLKLKTFKPLNLKLLNFKFLVVVFTFSFLVFNLSFANLAIANSELTVSPAVIDEKAKARDIFKKSLTITNASDRKLNLYPTVNNINPLEGDQDFEQAMDSSDRVASLANWIELSRGVIELKPGEQKNIPFIIRVNLNAEPGNYHARITFAEGGTRAEAEKKADMAAVMVNLEVLADIKEEMQLGKFITDRIFFSGDDVLFNYQLENIGNKEVAPKGEIRIYNRKGEEVASIDANKEGKIFEPDKVGQLASVWNAESGFGRYKAFLNMNYGDTQRGTIQDTVFFWVVPWKSIAGIFGGSLLAVIFFASIFHRWLERKSEFAQPKMETRPSSSNELPYSDEHVQQQAQSHPTYTNPQNDIRTTNYSNPSWSTGKRRSTLAVSLNMPDILTPKQQQLPAEILLKKEKEKRIQMHDHPFLRRLYEKEKPKKCLPEKHTSVRQEPDLNHSGNTIDMKKVRKQHLKNMVNHKNHVIDLRDRNEK